MLTDEEYKKRWRRISQKGRKFIIRYIENGLDAYDAASYAGFHGTFLNWPHRPLRKYNDVIDYLLKKNDIINTFVKPEWVMAQFKDLYDRSKSEGTKLGILSQLSKILAMINTSPQVQIDNNIPQTPVVIKFDNNNE